MGKVKKYIQAICEILEMLAAGLVLLGIVLSMIGILKNLPAFRALLMDVTAFRHYLEGIFLIVIGIEFLEMLCRPNSDNILEVLIFLVARHMIVGETTPYMDFVSVISVGLLCFLRRYLHVSRLKEKEREAQLKTQDPSLDEV